MSIRLVLPRHRIAKCLVGARRARRETPANDNAPEAPCEATLEAALRHFGAHGLAAARTAFIEAEAAAARGDRDAFERWHTICHALDRRMARSMARDDEICRS